MICLLSRAFAEVEAIEQDPSLLEAIDFRFAIKSMEGVVTHPQDGEIGRFAIF